MRKFFFLFPVMVSLIIILSSCVPSLSVLQAPKFRLISEGSGLQSINPSGIGSSEAVFLFYLEATNPTPLAMNMQGLDFDFYINNRYVADGRTATGVSLPAGGSNRIPVEIRIPLENNLTLLTDFVGLVAGQPTSYRIDGTVVLDLFGLQQALPKITLVEGNLQEAFPLQIPSFTLIPGSSGINIGLGTVGIQVGMEVSNPGPMGYILRAPNLHLKLGNTQLAVGQVIEVPIPAFGSAIVPIRLDVNALQLASDIATIGLSGEVSMELSGSFGLDVPGITQGTFPAQTLLSGLLSSGIF